jgi:hypothetical protein
MSLLSKVWFVIGSANRLRRSIAQVRLLNLMAIVVTFSTPVIYTFAADTPLLLEPHSLIVDHSLPKEEADTQIIAARRYDTFWNTGDETLARASLAPNFVDNTSGRSRAKARRSISSPPTFIASPMDASLRIGTSKTT